GAAARGGSFHDAGAALFGDLFEMAVLQVAVEVLVLGVFEIGFGFVDFWIYVAVRHENVEPTVVIHVEEADAPAEQARVDTNAAGISTIFEGAIAQIRVERIGIAGE